MANSVDEGFLAGIRLLIPTEEPFSINSGHVDSHWTGCFVSLLLR